MHIVLVQLFILHFNSPRNETLDLLVRNQIIEFIFYIFQNKN
jgi:hypothetical protein